MCGKAKLEILATLCVCVSRQAAIMSLRALSRSPARLAMAAGAVAIARVAAATPSLLFVSTAATNDLATAAQLGNLTSQTFATVDEALAAAAPGDGLLLVADAMVPVNPGVPQTNTTVNVTAAQWDSISKLDLSVYIEFPSQLPPAASSSSAVLGVGSARARPVAADASLPVAQTLWERVAVSASGGLGAQLPYLALLHPHKHVDYVQLPASLLPQVRARAPSLLDVRQAAFSSWAMT